MARRVSRQRVAVQRHADSRAPQTKHVVNFIATPPGDEEKAFHFQTTRASQLGALFRQHVQSPPADALFPRQWPPMRYNTEVHPERNITGINK